MADIKVDTVVDAYLATRDRIEELEREHKEKVKELKTLQDKREQWLHEQLDLVGVENMKAQHGTVFKKKKEHVRMGDWDTFLEYVASNQHWELLNKAVNKTEALTLMGEERIVTNVPGVNYSSEIEVQVRRK